MKNLKDKPFALLGVHIGGLGAKELKEVMEKEKITWRSFVDHGNAGAGPIATKWNLASTPSFYLIDHQGMIRYKWAGPPGEKVLDAALDKLIKAADDEPKVTRRLDGDKYTFPAKTVEEGTKALIAAIESCHSSDWVEENPPAYADPEKAQKGDHVRFVFKKPITVTVLTDRLEVTEAIFANGAFLLRADGKVMRSTKYEFQKMKPFLDWYGQTLPVDK
ncbi:MAG TPA: hypothetical protein VKE40_06555 [Gemmataceae bacterium]|nr:hypothetical protein [Gemmataceae bacterium]